MLFSCTKEEVNTVGGNQAPEDPSVDQLTVDNYINRIYIGLLGRKADDAEFETARDLFEGDPAAKKNREDLIDLVQSKPEYLSNLVFRAKLDLIEGVDSVNMVFDYILILAQLQDSSLAFIKPLLEEYKIKQEKLLTMNVDFVLDGLDMRRYFDAVVTADHVAHSKPDPETFLKAARQLGMAPQDCLVFEDAPKGVEAALNAGMQTVVLTTMHEKEEFAAYPNIRAFVADYTDPVLYALFQRAAVS